MNKRLLILLLSLLIVISSMNIIFADDGWNTGGSTKYKYYQWHELNGTIVGKHSYRGYIDYLVNINGETFFLDSTYYRPYDEFYLNDKVTMKGNTYYTNTEIYGYTYGHLVTNEFGGAYQGKTLHYLRLDRYESNGEVYAKMKLAEGFVRGGSSSTTASTNTDNYINSMSILEATITSGEYDTDKTNCTVFVGKGYAGESVKISVLYSTNGENLNKGLKVDKTVSDSGKIKVPTLDGFKEYPDKAIITIYDSNGNKLDSRTVDLEPNSNPQHFKFYTDPEYASNGAKFVGYAGDGGWANYYKDGHYYTVDGEQID